MILSSKKQVNTRLILANLEYLRRDKSHSPFLVYHTIVMGSTDGMDWLCRPRDYELESKRLKSQRVSTTEHPLRGTVVKTVQGSNVRATKNTPNNNTTKSNNNNNNNNPLDPLSSSDSFEGMDPLSMMARSETNSNNNNNNSSRNKKNDTSQRFGDAEGYIDETFEPWSEKRADVLLKYTTSEKLTISTSFLTDNDKERIQVSCEKVLSLPLVFRSGLLL